MFEKIIVENNQISSFFVKANLYISEKYKEELTTSLNKEKTLSDLWFKEFRGTLHKSDGVFTKVNFEKNKDLIIFNLKFD